jgi:hypothetical protein
VIYRRQLLQQHVLHHTNIKIHKKHLDDIDQNTIDRIYLQPQSLITQIARPWKGWMLIVLIMLSILYGTSSTKFHLNKLSNNLTHDKSNFATKDMDYSVTSLLLTLQAGINHNSYDMGGGNNEDTEVGIQINLMEEIANIYSK